MEEEIKNLKYYGTHYQLFIYNVFHILSLYQLGLCLPLTHQDLEKILIVQLSFQSHNCIISEFILYHHSAVQLQNLTMGSKVSSLAKETPRDQAS